MAGRITPLGRRAIDALLYAGYSARTAHPREFVGLLTLAARESGRSRAAELRRVAESHLRYQTHPLDYFYLRLFREPLSAHGRFANTWQMHQFHRRFNDPRHIETLRNKRLFRERMSEFTAGGFTTLDAPELPAWLRTRVGRRIVAKNPTGSAGKGVSFHTISAATHGLEIDGTPAQTLLDRLRRQGRTLLEDYLLQHPDVAEMYDGSLNTVRVITFLRDDGHVEIWAALIRIGCEGYLDNFHAGGLTAAVDIGSGVIRGPLVQMNPFLAPLAKHHPVTRALVMGRALPHWPAGIDLVTRAAKANPKVRTVGWDLALLEQGPAILEGNDNWDKTQWQLGLDAPQGMKEAIESRLSSA